MPIRKSSLSLVGSPPTGGEPPPTSPGAKLWKSEMAERKFTRAGDRELLKQICIMTDRVEAIAEQIEADGEVYRVRGKPTPHPALRDELAARAFIARSLARLGIVGEPKEERRVGRPATGASCRITYEQLQELRGDDDDE